MISMQRSLSSPVAIRPSVSPSTTRAPRSPTPSPDDHVELALPRRFTTRSPTSAAEPTMSHARRSEDLPRRPSAQQPAPSNASRKPIIAQAAVPSSDPPGPRDSSDSLGTVSSPPSLPVDRSQNMKFPCHLLPDVSLYTNHISDQEHDSTTLEELAHLVRLSKYQERKRANTRIRLQRSLISTALSARLMRCGQMAHRNLVDCFRGDDKKTFAALYNAVIDVRRSCDETRRYAILEPDMELLHSPSVSSTDGMDTPTTSIAGGGAVAGSITPFLNDISASARETFLNFLTQIRTNPTYLASRIASLDLSELTALTSFHQGLEPIESVLPYHNRQPGRGTGTSANRNPVQERNAIERLLSFQRHDPLSALIHTCFANSAGPDSAEDKRRTTIWATACARLISEQKPGFEATAIAVINAWVAMRDWSGKSNMEWYLMKILEDGSFLLDRAEDQLGTRFNLSDWTSKDQIASEEFYDRATSELLDVIDDEDATGIPEGLIELGNEILRKLDNKYVDSTRKWFVYKWLFTVWLLGVVVHPESYGMMAEYHITEYGRQKILKNVALRAQQHVVDLMWDKLPATRLPKVKTHIDNILARFKDSKSRKSKPRLLPARSITSLRETAEVHPYLVISPADLATLVNALFPEKRPLSAQSNSFRSGAPSISGFSVVSQPMSRATFDSASVLSTSAESVASEATTSGDPPIDEPRNGSPRRYSPPILDPANQKRLSSYEDDGYRLRLAMHEMTQILGQDVVHGSCHPCAERWAVLFISSDGNALSTHMTYDPDDDIDEEENSSTSDTADEDTEDDRPELDKSYHQLRDSILRLVEDFEIPQTAGVGGTRSKTFSNRASSLKKYRTKNRIITSERTMGSRNPYRKRLESVASSQSGSPPKSAKGKESHGDIEDRSESSVLVDMLKAASSQSRAQSDFVSAHLYWRTLQQLNLLASESLRRNGFSTLLNIFSRGPRDSLRRSASAIEEYDAWLIWLKQSQERVEGLNEMMMRRFRALRDKMWYVTDVRNSAPYEQSRNIAVALKAMGMPRKWNSLQRARGRGPTANYLFRTESQIVDLLTASEDQGGPNKLSDDQAEKTSRWLLQYGIENFCRGEERIHRFCCEVDSCLNKLVGDSIVDTPVLWSSELYLRDRRSMESGRGGRDRESHTWDDAASVISDPERRFGSMGRPMAIPRDLRNMSGHNVSQASFDSGRFSFSRASTAMSDVTDSQDYFGASSPIHTIDSSTTFWSPFQATIAPGSSVSRAQSPTTSITNFSAVFSQPHHQHLPSQSRHSTGRPGTSASSNETVYQQRTSEEKTRFLAELRQTLTSLLLSDLGNLVFARGSETDGWFEGLGQECIDRREAIRRRSAKAARKSPKTALKKRAIEKRSLGKFRASGSAETTGDKASSDAQTQGLAPESAGSHGNDSSATSDTVSARADGQKPLKDAMAEFPFKKSYQRLLRMFCVHPNPYMKLNALCELENLIVASLTSGSRKSRSAWARLELGSTSSASDDHTVNSGTGRAKPLEEAIDNVKERRLHTLQQHPVFSGPGHVGRASGGAGNFDTRSVATANPANTDAIANILQALFREQSLRPKTLFRDLQFISSFVPASVLDKPERGKAFWDAGLAALNLKNDVCKTMVEVADEVVKVHTQTRSGGMDPSPAPNRPHSTASSSTVAEGGPSGIISSSNNTSPGPGDASSAPPSPPPIMPLMTYSFADAARMLTITAKEGDPTAQRELAIFYLGNSELVERTTLPLSKPREVFRQAVMDKYGGSGGGAGGRSSRYHHTAATGVRGAGQGQAGAGMGLGIGGGGGNGSGGSGGGGGGGAGPAAQGSDGPGVGDVRSDPALMCLAIHWMNAAEQGGDEPARTFLGQNEISGL